MAKKKWPAGIKAVTLVDGTVKLVATAYGGYDDDGKKIRISKRFDEDQLMEAVNWRNTISLKHNSKQIISYGNMSVPDAFEAYYLAYREPNLAENTKQSWRSNIARLRRTVSQYRVRDVKQSTVQQWFKMWATEGENPLSRTSQVKLKGRLRAFFASAVADEIIAVNPVTENVILTGAEPTPSSEKFLELDAYLKIRHYLEAQPMNTPQSLYMVWLLLAFDTGARPGEVSATEWSDLKIDGNDEFTYTISKSYAKLQGVKSTKTGNVRTVMLTPTVAAKLREWRSFVRRYQLATGKRTDFLFMTENGTLPYNNSVNRIFRRLQTQLGVPEDKIRTAHSIRHTVATVFLDELGLDVNFVSHQLGHSNLKTTAGYVHNLAASTERKAKEAVRGLEAL